MEIRCCEGCVDFDSPEKPSEQLLNEWDETEFIRETAAVFKNIARNNKIMRSDLRRWLMNTKFNEQRGRNKTLPHEAEAEIEATFRELDLHHDGCITLPMFRKYHRARFNKVVSDLIELGQ
eukprot:TRINITY_DN3385_c0_g3_i1.p1 TRINITY_DN3385_c0_g3~~TRINITY_DN3385_c0_g3_i1.p1  ORF type:complete len:121 (+),score=23.56 TRINITY_DN3385_c0_g3_i1:58-420(+)